jgi:hypothetical protein
METSLKDKITLENGVEVRKAGTHLVTIRGIVVPADWDEKGKVVAVAVSTYDEVEYFIENHEKEKELKTVIREEVEVRGIVKEEGKKLIMKVKDYRLKPRLMSERNSKEKKPKIKKDRVGFFTKKLNGGSSE